jgi:hypothetical protein
MTLEEFLRARLDEDERLADRAASLCGCHPSAPSWTFKDGDGPTDGRILIADDPHPNIKRKLSRRWNNTYEGLFAAEHIARHDPARVLAEVEVKRRIIDLHGGDGHECIEHTDEQGDLLDAFTPEHPCPTLRLLARPYASHPDYRDEWCPA